MKIIRTSKGIYLYTESTITLFGVNIGYKSNQYVGCIKFDKLYKKYNFKPYQLLFGYITYSLEEIKTIYKILKELEDKRCQKKI